MSLGRTARCALSTAGVAASAGNSLSAVGAGLERGEGFGRREIAGAGDQAGGDRRAR